MEHTPENNLAAFIISSLFFVMGSILKSLNSLPPIPQSILTYVQLISFVIAIIVGLKTILKKEKKNKEPKKPRIIK